MTRIAINGLGRIGKLLLRALVDRGLGGDVVLLNDRSGDAAQHALLLEFDSIHGKWPKDIAVTGNGLGIMGHRMRLTDADRIADLPLGEMGVDMVLDCTGAIPRVEAAGAYFEAGVAKVLVSAPIADDRALNLVYGINHGLYDPARHDLVTAASCTTNCLAPVVEALHPALGIRHGAITTLHDVTNTQTIADRPAKDMRRARSALNNLIPTTTGSAKAIGMIFPDLAGRLNGHAVRVPLLNASLTDCVFELERGTTVEEVNGLFREAAEGRLRGILGYETRPLVSSDFLNESRSAVIDAASTMMVDESMLKVYAWYDNEWGYVSRMADIAVMMKGADGRAL